MSEDTGLQQRTLKSLKFASGPRMNAATAHQEGREAATVRYDDEKGIQEGDRLALKTETGDDFAVAEVTCVKEVFAWRAFETIQERNAMYGPHSSEHLISTLNYHYDATIWPSTRVKVIFFEPISFAVDDSESSSEDPDCKEVAPRA